MRLLLTAALATLASAETLHVALRQNNLDELKRVVDAVSDPQSPMYGQYLTQKEVADLVAPHPHTTATVAMWLEQQGGSHIRTQPSGDVLTADFADPKTAHRLARATPEELGLHEHVDLFFLHRTDYVRNTRTPASAPSRPATIEPRSLRLKAPVLADSNLGTPRNLRMAYGIPSDLRGSNATNLQMIWGPGTFGYLKSDLRKFYSVFEVDAVTDDVSVEGYEGQAGGDNFLEGSLDIQCISGMAPGVPTIVANTNTTASTETSDGFGYALLEFAHSLSSRDDESLPKVLSMSLGSLSAASCRLLCERIDPSVASVEECRQYVTNQRQVCMFSSEDQLNRIDREFMKAAARGVTLLAASGDGGSHFSFTPFEMDTALGRALNKASCSYNMPTYPASSPYVLAVGGTSWPYFLGKDHPVYWPSGGASFSWQFEMPEYQRETVQAYLASAKLPTAGSFNASMRAYPDVAALADKIPIVANGNVVVVGGTSASAPIFAGIISLLNDVRLNAGLPALGFINPRLYQVGQKAFHDITHGNTRTDCAEGFEAAPGWDATSGFGAPRWNKLIKYFGSDN